MGTEPSPAAHGGRASPCVLCALIPTPGRVLSAHRGGCEPLQEEAASPRRLGSRLGCWLCRPRRSPRGLLPEKGLPEGWVQWAELSRAQGDAVLTPGAWVSWALSLCFLSGLGPRQRGSPLGRAGQAGWAPVTELVWPRGEPGALSPHLPA